MKQTILIAVLTMFLIASCTDNKPTAQEPAPIDTIPMMVMQIQKCAKLHTAEVHVHKIVTHDDQMKLKGSFLQKDNKLDRFGERLNDFMMRNNLK